MSKKLDRTIYTPQVSTADLAETDEALVFWKQILPEAPIQYNADGQTRTIDFNAKYHKDCINSFREKAIDQTCFQLADSKNNHGRDFDPERQRAEVIDMATLDDLPADVQEKVGHVPGLYAKMRFFDRKAVKAVRANPKLGVSARVRENFMRADGKFVKRAVIHVLGTIDPRVTGMSGWQAADLSYSPDDGYVLDLSNATYEGNAAMSKKATKGETAVIGIPSDEEIEAFTDDELDAFLASGIAAGGDDDETDDDDDDDTDDGDDDNDGAGAEPTARKTVGASLSNKAAAKAIDLANAQAAQANARALDAQKRQAKAEFKAYRTEMIAAGVRPADLDMCQGILTRPDEMVVDLSVSDDDDINVTEVIRALLESHKGDIDMSEEAGHGGSLDLANGGVDPDAEILDAWDSQFGSDN